MSESKFNPHPDPEMREFEEALLRSIDESLRGEGRLSSPEPILAPRSSGKGWQRRPRPDLHISRPRTDSELPAGCPAHDFRPSG